MANEVEQRALARYLEDHHLKHTKQREAILDVFLSLKGHTTSESLYQEVRAVHANIGYTTVYRTMKLLCEAGLAQEASFDGITRYEIAPTGTARIARPSAEGRSGVAPRGAARSCLRCRRQGVERERH
jgi:Fe2+ or Zn2+ uptake regulation protein